MTTVKSIMTLMSCENQKIYRQLKYRTLPVITAFIIITGGAVSMIPGNTLSFTMENYPYTILAILNYVIMPPIIFMLASDLLSGEMGGNEIKVLLTRPVSRSNILIAKVLSITCYAGIILVEGLVLSSIISIISAGFLSFNFVTILAYIVGFFPLLTLVAMSAMIASMLKSGTSCFSFCLIAYVGFMVLGLIFSGLSPALFTSYLGIGSMVIGSVIPFSSLLMGVGILVGYTLAFLSVSGLKFVDRDF